MNDDMLDAPAPEVGAPVTTKDRGGLLNPGLFIGGVLGLALACLSVLHVRQQRALANAMGDLDKITDSVLEYATILRQLDPTRPEPTEPLEPPWGPPAEGNPVRDIGTAKPAGRPAKAGGQSGGESGSTSAQS